MFITKHGYYPAMNTEDGNGTGSNGGAGASATAEKPKLKLDDEQKELVNNIVKERLGEQKVGYEKKITEMEGKIQELLAAKSAEKPKALDNEELAKKYVPREDYEKLTTDYKKERELRYGTYQKSVRAEIVSAIAELKAISGSEDLILLGVEPFIKIEDDGSFKVLNESKEITRINGEGKAMSIRELVTDFVNKRPFLLPPGAAGAGTGKNNGKGADAKELTRAEYEALNQKDKAAFMGNGGKLK